MAQGLVGIVFQGKDELTKVTKKIGNSFKSAGKETKKFGKDAAGSFGIPITPGAALIAVVAGIGVAFASVVKEGTEFTKTMSTVGAVSGATDEQMKALEATAKDLGKTTVFSAKEAAEGMTFLAQAGFETNEIISAMPGTLNLAAAANLDLASSADIVSNVVSGFGASVDETNRFVDVLTNTFTTSNTSLVQLGEGMKFVAPVAAGLGLSVEQTAAAMGVLGNAGIQASSAGTNLRAILLRLGAPTGAVRAELEKLGISIFDSSGAMLPFEQVIGNVNVALAGMTSEQRTASVATLAGLRNISAFNILLGEGEQGLAQYTSELGAQGTAAEVANKQLDNLAGDQALLNSAVSAFKLEAFEAFEPALRRSAQGLTDFVGALGNGLTAWASFGSQVDRILNGITRRITETINAAIGIFNIFGQKIEEAFKGIASSVGISEDAFDGLGVQIKKLNVPVKSVAGEISEIEKNMLPIGPMIKRNTTLTEAQTAELNKQIAIQDKLSDLDTQRLVDQRNIARAMTDDSGGMDISAGAIAQFQEIKEAQVASQTEAAEASKKAWSDRFSEVSGVVSSVLGEGISSISDLNIDFGEDASRQVGENARRLAIIASKGFIDETDTSIQALAAEKPEIFQQLLESEDPAGLAKQMLSDFQLGIGAGKLIDKGAAKDRVRRILFGQSQLKALTNEIAQELVGEGFAAEEVNAALDTALGNTAEVSQGQFAPALTETAGSVTAFSDTITSTLLPVLNELLKPAFDLLLLTLTTLNEFLISILLVTLNDLLLPTLNMLLLSLTLLNEFMVGVLIPTLNDLLLPALEAVWDSIEIRGIPDVVGLTGSYEELWNSVNSIGLPTLQNLVNMFKIQLSPVLLAAKKEMKDFANSMKKASSAVKRLISKIQQLKNELASLNPPAWLQGQSPPPMANWLSDIADEADRASQSILGLRGGLRLSNNPAIGGTNTGGGATNSTSNTFNLTVNSNSPKEPILQDFQSMRARIASV